MKRSVHHDVASYLALVPGIVASLRAVPSIKERASESPFFASVREEYDIVGDRRKVRK